MRKETTTVKYAFLSNWALVPNQHMCRMVTQKTHLSLSEFYRPDHSKSMFCRSYCPTDGMG